jgi:hypothetical protein
MSPKKFVYFNFTTPQGEKRSEPVIFGDSEGRSPEEQDDVNHRKQPWISYSAWIGSSWRGYTQYTEVDGRRGVYMMERDGIAIAFLPEMYGADSLKVGQTGIGRLYSGYITYRVPIDFAWECVPSLYYPSTADVPRSPQIINRPQVTCSASGSPGVINCAPVTIRGPFLGN